MKQERDRTRERGRGSTRRPRLRRSLSVGAVAGPSCPACAQVSVLSSPRFLILSTVIRTLHDISSSLSSSPSSSNVSSLPITKSFLSVVSTVSCRASLSLFPSLFLSLLSLSLSFFPFLGLLFSSSRGSNESRTNGVRVSDESRRVATWCDIRYSRLLERRDLTSWRGRVLVELLFALRTVRGVRGYKGVSHKVYTTEVIVERYKLLGISNERRTSFTGQQRPGGSR